jgi:hypothetical protein
MTRTLAVVDAHRRGDHERRRQRRPDEALAELHDAGSLTRRTAVSIHAIRTGSPTDNLVAELQSDNGSGLPFGDGACDRHAGRHGGADDARFVRRVQGHDDEA